MMKKHEAPNIRRLKKRLTDYKELSKVMKNMYPTWQHALRSRTKYRNLNYCKIWWDQTHTKFNLERLELGEEIGEPTPKYLASCYFDEYVWARIIKLRCPKGTMYIPVEESDVMSGYIYHIKHAIIVGKGKNYSEHENAIDELFDNTKELMIKRAKRYYFDSTIEKRKEEILNEIEIALGSKKELEGIISGLKFLKGKIKHGTCGRGEWPELNTLKEVISKRIKILRARIKNNKESVNRKSDELFEQRCDPVVSEAINEIKFYLKEISISEIIKIFNEATIEKGA